MLKKTVALMVFLVVCSLGTAFAYQIDSLATNGEPGPSSTQVFVNPGGLGDVLIYGYFNARTHYQTFFTVTNTDTTNGARVRLRFREAATQDAPDCNGSYEILDFSICLSPGDMWTGYIGTDANGLGTLYSPDDDTYVIYADGAAPARFATRFPDGVPFKDILIDDADQTREGYFEIIAEEQLSEVSSGGDCGPTLDTNGADVGNVLMGHAYIVNYSTSASFGYNATALGNFSAVAITNDIGTSRPQLDVDSEDGTIVPVNYALTKSRVATIFDVESQINTEVIVTFPTKLLTHTCLPITDDIFDDNRVIFGAFDDAEFSPLTVCEFSPCAPDSDQRLPHEVNVLKFNNSAIFNSDVDQTVNVSGVGDFGWFFINMVDTITTPASPAHQTCYGNWCSNGLPAIGYVVHDISAGVSTGMLPLHYQSDVELAPIVP